MARIRLYEAAFARGFSLSSLPSALHLGRCASPPGIVAGMLIAKEKKRLSRAEDHAQLGLNVALVIPLLAEEIAEMA